jgi:hypothetical protein
MTGARRRVLVVVDADPRISDRAVEALRMSVGVAVAENRVRVLLGAAAAGFLDPATAVTLPGAARARGFLDALASLGAEVVRNADPADLAADSDVVLRWTEAGGPGRELRRHGPEEGWNSGSRHPLTGEPGGEGAPDVGSVVDAILGPGRVVVW